MPGAPRRGPLAPAPPSPALLTAARARRTIGRERNPALSALWGGGTVTDNGLYVSYARGQANGNSFQYTGRENDGTALYFYRARYYHPSRGRFIREDPLDFAGGDVNRYAYVLNAPSNDKDPTGLFGEGCADEVFSSGSPWGRADVTALGGRKDASLPGAMMMVRFAAWDGFRRLCKCCWEEWNDNSRCNKKYKETGRLDLRERCYQRAEINKKLCDTGAPRRFPDPWPEEGWPGPFPRK